MKAEVGYNKFHNKVHIWWADDKNPLCGAGPNMLSQSTTVDDLKKWVTQSDPDNQRCLKCSSIARKKLKELL